MNPVTHRGPAVVLLLLTAVILETLRRLTGQPKFGDVRGFVVMGGVAFAIAAAVLVGLALVFHIPLVSD
jgi:hypothetical protein